MALPLEGIRVLSMAEQLPGPYCSMLLSDLGAEVILVERPGLGDPARMIPHFLSVVNRNKKSITVNLKSEKGKDICYKLAEKSDVFLEGFRPGVLKRLNVDYESIKKINPKIVYCSITGYGQTGPYKSLPGHDLSYQAAAGLLSSSINKGDMPEGPGIAVADLSSAMFATIGILSALRARDTQGIGQHVDISMTDGLVSWMSVGLGLYFNTGSSEISIGKEPAYGIFKAKDGKYLTLSIAHEDYFWRNLCLAIGKPDLAEMNGEQRREKREEMVSMLNETLLSKPRDEWLEILGDADVPCGPASTIGEVATDPQIMARNMIVELAGPEGKIKQVANPIKFSETPTSVRSPQPKLGEHTDEVLTFLGYSAEELKVLRSEGVI